MKVQSSAIPTLFVVLALLSSGGVRSSIQPAGAESYTPTTIGYVPTTPLPPSSPTLTSLSATAIAAGAFHTCALIIGGGVKCWGWNDGGQLGNSTTIQINYPDDVCANVACTLKLSGVKAIAAGGYHTCALTVGGGVKCWGANGSGQLGDGGGGVLCGPPGYLIWVCRLTPVDVCADVSCALKLNGVSSIAGGAYHTCALITGGGVKCWGDNTYGQLGDGTNTDRHTPVDVCVDVSCTLKLTGVSSIAAGWYYTCALMTGGGVKCWGWNAFGQVGDGGKHGNSTTPVDVCADSTCASPLSGVTAIAAHGDGGHTCALTANGDVKCWGRNDTGQLGNGGGVPCNSSIYCTTPVDVCADGICASHLSGVSSVATGSLHTCAVTGSGRAKCWGYNQYGQLGDSTTTLSNYPVDVCADITCTLKLSGVSAIALGGPHTCALMDAVHGGGVKCWGYNQYGQLGDGTYIDRHTPVDVVEFGGYSLIQLGVVNLISASRQNVATISQAASQVGPIGDYFRGKLTAEKTKRIVDLEWNGLGLLMSGVSWAKVGTGLNDIATPGFKAATDAAWRGWGTDGLAAKFFQPFYYAAHGNSAFLFRQTALAGIKYYALEAGQAYAEDKVKDWAIQILSAGNSTSLNDYFARPAVLLGTSYQSELLREQNKLLVQLPNMNLTQAQISAYRADMLARQQVDAQITSLVTGQRDFLQHSNIQAKADEASWLNFWGPILVKYAIVGGATLAFDGPGFYVASFGTDSVQTIYDFAKDSATIDNAQKMLDQSIRFLGGRVPIAYMQETLNTMGALNLIRARDAPEIAGGNVAVNNMQSFGLTLPWPYFMWSETGSQLQLTIDNTTFIPTTYQTVAVYNHTETLVGTQRIIIEGQAVHLGGLSGSTVVIPLKSANWGVSPDPGSMVDILVTGVTETGIYPVAYLHIPWNATQVNPLSRAVAHVTASHTPLDIASVPTVPYPLASSLTGVPDTSDYALTIDVENPFTMPVQTVVTQTVPQTLTVLDTGGAVVSGNSLVWTTTLSPSTGVQFVAQLGWSAPPGSYLSLEGPQLAFWDPQTNSGYVYTAPLQTTPAIWPISESHDIAPLWQSGQSVTIPITLTNTSIVLTSQGLLTTTIASVQGTSLYTVVQPVSIGPGATQALTVTLPKLYALGFVIASTEMSIGDVRRVLFQDVVVVQGYMQYMPVVLR